MKKGLKKILSKLFGKIPMYRALAGGLRYYNDTEEGGHDPAKFLNFGKNTRLESGVMIAAPERLYIGDDVGISQNCYIQAVGGCHIGNGCQFAREVLILTTEHSYAGADTLPFGTLRLIKPVYIEDYVWIGTRVSIAPGVRIGEGAIVAMGSVVFQDVPPLAIVMGNPAKPVMFRSREEFEKLKAQGRVIQPYEELPNLRIPPVIMRKYKNELAGLGFDVSAGHSDFFYDKFAPKGQRLKPVDREKSAS